MSAEIETHGSQATFATLREPAWHRLGTVLTKPVDTAGMLKAAHLDNWNVELIALSDYLPEGVEIVDDKFLTIRDNPFIPDQRDVLGVVGGRYKVSQNEELFSFGDAILDGGGRWETAGSIRNGTVVFGSLALDREIILDENGAEDKINTYLMLNTSHDGSSAIEAMVTPIRVVCSNTLTWAKSQSKKAGAQSFKIRHTTNMEGKVRTAREALALADKYLDAWTEDAKVLVQTKMTDAQFHDVLVSLDPQPDEDAKAATTRWENRTTTIKDIFAGSADGGNTVENIAGTAWAGYNAMTEYLDWYRNPRANNPDGMSEAASGFVASVNKQKNLIHDRFMAFATQ